jgi:hypothetical protein
MTTPTSGPTTPLERMSYQTRRRLVRTLWVITWLGLLAGLYDHRWYQAVVVFSILHTALFLTLTRFRVAALPNQVRIAYLLWVAVSTYVPGAMVMMWVPTIGLATNIFFDYCPAVRMIYLMPWNLEEPLTWSLVVRVFTTPPSTGRFTPRPESRRVASRAST